jgi:hypothetical protein
LGTSLIMTKYPSRWKVFSKTSSPIRGTRLPRTLLDPAAFKEVGRVNFVQVLLRWVELEPRISGVADSGYFLLGSCGRGGASEDLEHTGGRPLLTMGDLAKAEPLFTQVDDAQLGAAILRSAK